MGVYIVGFICALILAGLVVAWIAYCMFVREHHKSEYYQYNISDIQYKNNLMSLNQGDADVEKEITAGVLILPSRRRHRDDEYEGRPDYPESPAPINPSTEKLINMFNDGVEACYKDGIYEVDSRAPFHSDV